MRNRIVLLGVIIGLLVGAAGVGLIVVSDDDDGTSVATLPKLPISAVGERAMAAADSMMMVGPIEWRVKGELPTLDDHAKAYRTGAPSDAARRRLTDAIPGAQVQPDGSWGIGMNRAVSSSGVAVACAPDGPCDAPPPSPPTTAADLPAKDEARRLALDAFEKAGIDTSGHVEVSEPSDAWIVSAEPKIDGRRVFGVINTLAVGPKGAFLWGGGQLTTTAEVGNYPLVDTQRGFERLKSENGGARDLPLRGAPEPAIAVAPVAPGEPSPVPPQPIVRTVTGVTLGLAPFGEYIAPAFLFETDDGNVWPVPAVVDDLLVQPGNTGTKPGPAPGGPPQEVPPAPPSPGGGGSSSSSCAGSSSAANAGGGDQNQPLTIEVCASPSSPKVGETVTFQLKASDPDAAMDADGCQQPTAGFGDSDDGIVQCMSLCSRESFPPEATAIGRTFTHAYAKPGTYTATFTADSCAPKASHGEVQLQITVSAG